MTHGQITLDEQLKQLQRLIEKNNRELALALVSNIQCNVRENVYTPPKLPGGCVKGG